MGLRHHGLDGPTFQMREKIMAIGDDFWIEDGDGKQVYKVNGNIVDHEYEIERDGHTIATVSKKWFRVRETYGVQLAQGQDVPLILAITVCVDAMARG